MQGFLLIEADIFYDDIVHYLHYCVKFEPSEKSSFSIGLYKRYLIVFLESVFFVVYTDSNQVTLIF